MDELFRNGGLHSATAVADGFVVLDLGTCNTLICSQCPCCACLLTLPSIQLELQSGARASAAAAAAASTPADVESLMRQNRDKLSMLKVGREMRCGHMLLRRRAQAALVIGSKMTELAALGEAGAVDRVDSFLKRFSNTHASLPENMLTPALRVNTPLVSADV
eukprot:scaffold136616_cov15-Tisochrysis_lutea.AAC.2